MKILLIQPFSFIKEEGLPSYSLGIYYIGAVLKKENHEVDIVDFSIESKAETALWHDIACYIKKYDILGVSFSSCPSFFVFKRTIEILKKIKNAYPELMIIVGGTYLHDKIDFIKQIDFINKIFIGNAEKSLLSYLNKPKSLITKNKIVKEKSIECIEQIPFPLRPSYETLNIPMLASRGCNNKCTFCSLNSINNIKIRSIDNILSEIDNILCSRSNKLPYFIFLDQNFLLGNINEIIKFASALMNNKIKIKWGMSLSLNQKILTKEIKLLKQSGLKSVFLGIESYDKNVLTRYNKISIFDKIDSSIETFMKNKINVSIGFIMYDLWTNIHEIKNNLLFLKKYGCFNNLIGLATASFFPYKSSKLGRIFINETKINKYYDLLWENDYKYFCSDIKVELIIRIFKDFLKLFYKYYFETSKKKLIVDELMNTLIKIVSLVENDNINDVNIIYYKFYDNLNKNFK